ncbi:hypothetical protein [Pseudolysinimonas yzui]|uniref:hypothetical protein n=1 Tax=Pseudolysinimonas yzui TaxID=2708254 RepID=UPI001749AB72|nr:hypothetical protein [Pseudolysinimonas yzui]
MTESKGVGVTPWPTFVLGNGCLTDDTSSDVPVVAQRLRALATHADAATAADPARAVGELVKQWVATVADEGGVALESVDADTTAGDLVSWDAGAVFEVVLAAALLGRVYAEAVAKFGHVITASRRSPVGFLATDGRWSAVDYHVVQPLTTVLTALNERTGEPPHGRLAALAGAIATRLKQHQIVRQEVDLFSSIAWYFVTEGAETYPGWGELLLLQGLTEEVGTDISLRPRRSNQRTPFAGSVTKRFHLATTRSWAQRRSAATSSRQKFYDAVVATVHTQAELHRRSKASESLPLPTVFVSSFDLELEMAFWAAGKPFSVVVPVISVNERQLTRDATFQWVTTTITPTGSPSDAVPAGLLTPAEWKPLRATSFRHGRGGVTAHPVIVRLAGSPLMTFENEGRAVAAQLEDGGETVYHALLLDDYSAYNLAALDLRTGELAHQLTSSGDAESPRRFWTFVGVQLGDPAVRLRLLAHEIAAAASNTPVASEQEAWRAGIVLNVHSTPEDTDAFAWYRLEPVLGTSVELTPSLLEFNRLFAKEWGA